MTTITPASAAAAAAADAASSMDEPVSAAAPQGIIQAIDPALCDRTQADIDLQKQQQAAWDAYYGKFRDSVAQQPRERNRNVKSNRCAAIVDKGAAWLAGPGLEIEVADKDAPTKGGKAGKIAGKGRKAAKAGAAAAVKPAKIGNAAAASQQAADQASEQADQQVIDKRQDWLDDALGSPDLFRTLLTMVFMTGAVTGHAFVKLVYDSKTMDTPRFTLLDSQHVYVLTDPDDCNIPVVYVVEFATPLRIAGAGGQAQQLVKRQIICRCAPDGTPRYGVIGLDGGLPEGVGEYSPADHWTIATYMRVSGTSTILGGASGAWRPVGEVVQWDFPFAPIVDAMNLPAPNQYYGLSDLPPELIALNERLNDVQSDTATILEQYSMPQPWATGFGGVEQIRQQPGTVLMLPQGASANVMQPRGDIGGNRDFANDLRADMDEQSRVPAVALGRQESLPKGNLSGVALELLFQPLVEKTMLKRALYGPLIQELCLRALVIAGQANYDDTEIRLHWGNLLPKDDAASAQMALAMSQVGTSQHAIDDVLGLDYDTETDYKHDEEADQLTAFSRGQGLPPTPPIAPPAEQPGQPIAPASPADAAANGAAPPPTTPPPTNHPAAIAARQRMQVANGKTPTADGM